MENANIHNVFADGNIRGFLAKLLQIGFSRSLSTSTACIKEQIAELEEMLSFAQQWEAALALIHSQGWEDWDVSDEIADYNRDHYFPFIGTAEEVVKVFEGYIID